MPVTRIKTKFYRYEITKQNTNVHHDERKNLIGKRFKQLENRKNQNTIIEEHISRKVKCTEHLLLLIYILQKKIYTEVVIIVVFYFRVKASAMVELCVNIWA